MPANKVNPCSILKYQCLFSGKICQYLNSKYRPIWASLTVRVKSKRENQIYKRSDYKGLQKEITIKLTLPYILTWIGSHCLVAIWPYLWNIFRILWCRNVTQWGFPIWTISVCINKINAWDWLIKKISLTLCIWDWCEWHEGWTLAPPRKNGGYSACPWAWKCSFLAGCPQQNDVSPSLKEIHL
mgnify:CR=1 FL=1